MPDSPCRSSPTPDHLDHDDVTVTTVRRRNDPGDRPAQGRDETGDHLQSCLRLLRDLTPDTGDDTTQRGLDVALVALEARLDRLDEQQAR